MCVKSWFCFAMLAYVCVCVCVRYSIFSQSMCIIILNENFLLLCILSGERDDKKKGKRRAFHSEKHDGKPYICVYIVCLYMYISDDCDCVISYRVFFTFPIIVVLYFFLLIFLLLLLFYVVITHSQALFLWLRIYVSLFLLDSSSLCYLPRVLPILFHFNILMYNHTLEDVLR